MMPSHAPPVFSLPAALVAGGYSLRPETDDDVPFLMRLYASTREIELQLAPWTEQQKRTFCAEQFRLQRRHYRTNVPNCSFNIIALREAAVGRLYIEPRRTQLYVVDIALMPALRGQGVGTAIMRALQTAASAGGRRVGIMVEKFNPALRLYRRLGFAAIADHEVYLEMEWRPEKT